MVKNSLRRNQTLAGVISEDGILGGLKGMRELLIDALRSLQNDPQTDKR
jgi:hypothetical protein